MADSGDLVQKYCQNGKVKCPVRCPKCPSLIFSTGTAELHTEAFSLPRFAAGDEPEEIEHWWKVDDMFKFENIGFRNAG